MMVIHYFTLLALCKELSSRVIGTEVQNVFTQQKSELLITCSSGGDESPPTLCISIEPRSHYFYARANFRRAKRNSSDLFPSLPGSTITALNVALFDRVIVVELAGRHQLIVQLYNTPTSNILLIDESRTVMEAFKNNKQLQGTIVSPSVPRFDDRLLQEEEVWVEALGKDPSLSILRAVKSAIPILGSVYARELLYRSNVDEEAIVSSGTRRTFHTLFQQLQKIVEALHHPEPAMYTKGQERPVLSLVPLTSLADSAAERCTSVNEAVQYMVARSHRAEEEGAESNRLIGKITDELNRAERTRGLILSDLDEAHRGEQYTTWGSMLMANLQLLSKGMKSIQLPGILDPHVQYEIVLDPKLGPVQNAERYFEKSKKAKVRRIESRERLENTERKIRSCRELLNALEECSSNDDVKKFKKDHEAGLRAMNLFDKDSVKELPPFRIFTVAGGYEVWVGKSSANNDLLTMKYAKPNDLWFHVRGASGSHTILRVPGGAEDPPKEAIRQAASIAVYYSKMRKAGQVPVAYCERKYVRKPKGVAAGAVFLEREKVIFVQPKLPENSNE